MTGRASAPQHIVITRGPFPGEPVGKGSKGGGRGSNPGRCSKAAQSLSTSGGSLIASQFDSQSDTKTKTEKTPDTLGCFTGSSDKDSDVAFLLK